MDAIQLPPKQRISGELQVPPSKSYAQRAIAIASLRHHKTILHQLGTNADVLAAQRIILKLGAQFSKKGKSLILEKGIALNTSEDIHIDCAESGLSSRLFSAFSLLYNQPFRITGKGSISNRTMEMTIDGLQQFGKRIESLNNHLPIIISGTTAPKKIGIDGSITSQFLTGLLIVTPFLPFDTEIEVHNLKSKPYIEMTLDLLAHFGIMGIDNDGFKLFHIKGGQKSTRETEYTVEGDWSSAAFMIVAGAIGGKVKLHGLKRDSKQADRKILEVVKKAGAMVRWEDELLVIEKSSVRPLEFDATDCPDLFPSLVVLAANALGTSIIKGVERLKHKESNRAIALKKECSKVGVTIELKEDFMLIHGKGKPEIKEEILFSSYNDHRMAMAMSLFSIGATHSIKIDNFHSINKSYPYFYKDLGLI